MARIFIKKVVDKNAETHECKQNACKLTCNHVHKLVESASGMKNLIVVNNVLVSIEVVVKLFVVIFLGIVYL